jgi:glutamate-1-semialdehyde 2,1-aminomutase
MANGFLLQQWQLLAGKVETCKLNFKEGCWYFITTHGRNECKCHGFYQNHGNLKRDQVVEHPWNYGGSKLISGMLYFWGIRDSGSIGVEGHPCSPNYVAKDKEGNVSLAMRTWACSGNAREK